MDKAGWICFGIGAVCNWTAERVNGSWKMPVMGVSDANDAYHIAMGHPKLWFLCDWIGNSWVKMSVGDIFLVVGLGLIIFGTLRAVFAYKSSE